MKSRSIHLTVAALSLAVCALLLEACKSNRLGTVEYEVRSDYSHIRVRRKDDIRLLNFVRDDGEEVIETRLDLNEPHRLLSEYTRTMFASYLFQPQPRRVLIVGLGGGAMVHFLNHHEPQVAVDALEIDPAVVSIADEYFGTRSSATTRIITADAFAFLQEAPDLYDVVYMDAFLKPSDDTDSTGVSLRLKTIEFYRGLQQRLLPSGVVVFNLNTHAELDEDFATIRSAFPQVYRFQVKSSRNVIAVATMNPQRAAREELQQLASQLDSRFQAEFSFQSLVEHMAD